MKNNELTKSKETYYSTLKSSEDLLTVHKDIKYNSITIDTLWECWRSPTETIAMLEEITQIIKQNFI